MNKFKTIFGRFSTDLLIVFLLVVVITWPCILLDRPFDYDHAIHIAKIALMKRNLLSGNGIFVWSHLWFGGYPTHLNYPFAAYLVTLGIHGLTLGSVSIDGAYALSLLITLFVFGWGVYLLAGQALPRYMALTAACFALLDGGDIFTGGYLWDVKYGVWPYKLSLGLCLMSLSFYLDAFRKTGFRNYLKAAIFLSAGMFCHPVALIFSGLVGATTVGFLIFRRGLDKKESRTNLKYLVLSLIIALGASLFWTGPMILGTGFAYPLGLKWLSFHDVFYRFFRFGLFRNLGFPLSYLIVVGTLFSCFFGTGFLRICAIAGLGLVVLATHEVSGATFGALSSVLNQNIERGRFVALAKPFLFIASTGALYRWMVFLKRLSGRRLNPFPLTLMLITVITASTLWSWNPLKRRDTWNTVWLSTNPFDSKLKTIENWLCGLQKSPSDFFRVAFYVDHIPSHHTVYNLLPSCQVPLLKLAHTSATSFRYHYGAVSLDSLHRLAVKYVIKDKEVSHPSLKLIERLDNFYVYEVKDFHGPATLTQGQGDVVLKSWGQDLITYEISRSKNAVVEIPVTDLGYWQVTQNSLPIITLNRARIHNPFDMQLRLIKVPVQDGVLKLTYQPPIAIFILSYFGLTVWLVMIGVYFWGNLRKMCSPH